MILDGFPDYPDENEVAVTMQSSSYWPKDTVKQQFALRQAMLGARKAARSWENLTGWGPFLSSGAVETRHFDASSVNHLGDLDLKCGLLRLDSVSIGGTALTTDFTPCLYPLNAPSSGRPYTELRAALGGNHGGLPGYGGYGYGGYGSGPLISITGVWGFSLSVPEDVYAGLLQVAAAVVLQQTENLQSIGSLSQDSFSKSFDITGILTQTALSQLWGKGFNTMVSQYWRGVN